MDTIIDLGTELVIDRTQIRTPQMQLFLAAIGRPLARGSAWIAVNKQIAAIYSLQRDLASPKHERSFAA